jgi:hypothetical protein
VPVLRHSYKKKGRGFEIGTIDEKEMDTSRKSCATGLLMLNSWEKPVSEENKIWRHQSILRWMDIVITHHLPYTLL